LVACRVARSGFGVRFQLLSFGTVLLGPDAFQRTEAFYREAGSLPRTLFDLRFEAVSGRVFEVEWILDAGCWFQLVSF